MSTAVTSDGLPIGCVERLDCDPTKLDLNYFHGRRVMPLKAGRPLAAPVLKPVSKPDRIKRFLAALFPCFFRRFRFECGMHDFNEHLANTVRLLNGMTADQKTPQFNPQVALDDLVRQCRRMRSDAIWAVRDDAAYERLLKEGLRRYANNLVGQDLSGSQDLSGNCLVLDAIRTAMGRLSPEEQRRYRNAIPLDILYDFYFSYNDACVRRAVFGESGSGEAAAAKIESPSQEIESRAQELVVGKLVGDAPPSKVEGLLKYLRSSGAWRIPEALNKREAVVRACLISILGEAKDPSYFEKMLAMCRKDSVEKPFSGDFCNRLTETVLTSFGKDPNDANLRESMLFSLLSILMEAHVEDDTINDVSSALFHFTNKSCNGWAKIGTVLNTKCIKFKFWWGDDRDQACERLIRIVENGPLPPLSDRSMGKMMRIADTVLRQLQMEPPKGGDGKIWKETDIVMKLLTAIIAKTAKAGFVAPKAQATEFLVIPKDLIRINTGDDSVEEETASMHEGPVFSEARGKM